MEILEKIQKAILTQLKELPEVKAFYLTGGTALSAFYLGHRKSKAREKGTVLKQEKRGRF